ncbi:MAG: hypothetical protein VX233_03275 [Candidatus Neomarinimicrobiota bacterium]|nr:hypothetical protein [Candidatus Neomarinimicrobiota bacterium]
MKKKMIYLFFISALLPLRGQVQTPSDFWNSQSDGEKVAFINGAYAAISTLKNHHQLEVKKQYMHNDNWVEPYYIRRFYDIADEYRSNEVGYNLKIIAMHMDAFYTNSDNSRIPVIESLRIVSLIQDGDRDRANLRLLKAQRKHNK